MRAYKFLYELMQRVTDHDDYALASHMALSLLTAMFPFLIFVASLAGMLGTADLQNEIVRLLFETWPHEVSEPIAREVTRVLGTARPGLLTVSAIVAVVLASNGVEAIRVGVNRAYGLIETRSYWWCRLQSLFFVVLASLALVTLALLVVLWPVMWQAAITFTPVLEPLQPLIEIARYGITTLVLGTAIVMVHLFLVASRPSLAVIWPGVLITMLLWLTGGFVFSIYITDFATYSRLYAGLGSVFAALFFLWLVALAFLLGAEINAMLAQRRGRPVRAR
ncbi:YihY/virulence factor BrkB family protein [Labrys neptuniae]